ncbi:alpha/beta fold hydrolase [Kutzneria sp. CA-103260]|uniref:alpha/beta fold hydrolase n=1 Tax=Kutzneria sp. CA-103260 TaxID=2802641 RepID=UPI00201363D0|nr:alpha/beta hydrolase [Kutzneria sp. CA-103260]
MYVHQWGEGPEVVLVHGAVLGGRECWRAQRPLTQRWTLLAVDRPGHGRTPAARQDFETESVQLADQLLDRPVHLVGYSYGGLVAMYAAVRRPENVRSLTVVEPPATALVKGNPVVDEWAARIRGLTSADGPLETVLREFLDVVGAPVDVTDLVHPTLLQGTGQLIGARPPDEAVPDLAALRGIPLLAVSGGHKEPYELICDAIAEATGAQRAVCPGAGHLVPDTGEPFNRVLEDFLTR